VTRPRLVAIVVIGLVLAVASNGAIELAYLGNGDPEIAGVTFEFLNGFLILNSLVGWAAGVLAGAIAGVVIVRAPPTRRLVRRSVPALAGVSALITWGIAGGWYVTKDVNDGVMHVCVPYRADCAPPVDPTPFILLAVALVLYLVAATLYLFSGSTRGVPIWSRVGRAGLLLLAVTPLLNVLGLLGFVIESARLRSARPDLSTELSSEHGSLTP
jgi:hypothetical protein